MSQRGAHFDSRPHLNAGEFALPTYGHLFRTDQHITKVLYGGSVTDENAESFFEEEFIDGALVGGASLDGTTFARIVNIFNKIK